MRMLSGPVVSVTVVDVVAIVVVVVEVVVIAGIVVVVVVVGQLPSPISSSFVFAPAMQVPALPPVLSALLQPHLPVQSLPHLMFEHGCDVITVVVEVMVVTVLFDCVESSTEFDDPEVSADPEDPDEPDEPDEPEPSKLQISLISLQQSPLNSQNSSQKHAIMAVPGCTANIPHALTHDKDGSNPNVTVVVRDVVPGLLLGTTVINPDIHGCGEQM